MPTYNVNWEDIFPWMTAEFKIEKSEQNFAYRPIRIQKNGPATIVFWQDGTKTIVKRADDEADNDYAAFTAALGIKLYGSNSALKKIVGMTKTQEPKKKRMKVAEQTEAEPTNRDELERVAANFGMTVKQALMAVKESLDQEG